MHRERRKVVVKLLLSSRRWIQVRQNIRTINNRWSGITLLFLLAARQPLIIRNFTELVYAAAAITTTLQIHSVSRYCRVQLRKLGFFLLSLSCSIFVSVQSKSVDFLCERNADSRMRGDSSIIVALPYAHKPYFY